MNPYEILGVPRDAVDQQVKAAFRREASKAHPDRAGGSAERMAAVNEAYAVLSDPKRREHYEKTGQTQEQTPIEVEASGLLAQIFSKALEQDDAGILEFAWQHTEATLEKVSADRRTALKKARRLRSKRNKVRTSDGARNLVHGLVDQQSMQLRVKAAQLRHVQKLVTLAREMLHAYEEDVPFFRTPIFVRANGMSASTTTWG